MKQSIAILLFALSIVTSAFCQTATMTPVGNTVTGNWQVKPVAVPTSTTAVVSVDAYLQTITVTNPTGSPVTFSVCDKQGSPICVLGAVSIDANKAYVISWPAYYWCPGGFSVLAGGSGLTFYAAWRQ